FRPCSSKLPERCSAAVPLPNPLALESIPRLDEPKKPVMRGAFRDDAPRAGGFAGPHPLRCSGEVSPVKGAPEVDRRNLPTYRMREASHYLGVPVSTLRDWSLGPQYRTRGEGMKRAKPLFTIAQRTPPALSFFNLVELY